jgi:hypothetical protein
MMCTSSAANWYRAGRHKVIWLALALFLACGSVASAAPTQKQTGGRLANSLAGLHRYFSSRSLDDLQSTVSALTSIVDVPRMRTRHYIARRPAIVQAWAQVLRAIELSYDSTVDLNDLPVSCVTPPMEASGKQLPPCADPNEITDLQTRAKYISAIQANELKMARVNFQTRLRLIDDQAMLSLRMNLDSFRAVTHPDFVALDQILGQAGLSATRRKKIDAIL